MKHHLALLIGLGLMPACTAEQPLFTEKPNLQLIAGQLGGLGLLDGNTGDNRLTPSSFFMPSPEEALLTSQSPWAANSHVLQALNLITGQLVTIGGNPNCARIASGIRTGACLGAIGDLTGDAQVVFLSASDGESRAILRIDRGSGEVVALPISIAITDDVKSAIAYDDGKLFYVKGQTLFEFDVKQRSSRLRASLSDLVAVDVIGDIVIDSQKTIYISIQNRREIISLAVDQTEPQLVFRSMQIGSRDGDLTSAQVRSIGGMAIDGDGKIFFTDPIASNIRTIDRIANTVTTVAGDPEGLARGNVDGRGAATRFVTPLHIGQMANQFYVADRGAGTVRSIEPNGGDVKTIAGNAGLAGNSDGDLGSARFSHPSTVVFTGSSLVAIDQSGLALRRVQTSGRQVDTIWESTSLPEKLGAAQFVGTLQSVALAHPLDGDKIFIAQSDQLLLFDVTRREASTVLTLDGTGPMTISALASDGQSQLFISDAPRALIYRLPLSGGGAQVWSGKPGEVQVVDGDAAQVRWLRPVAMAFDHQHSLYVIDANVVRKIDIATGRTETVAGNLAQTAVIDEQGALAGFASPTFIASASDGETLYVVDLNGSLLRQVFAVSHAVRTLAGVPYAAGIRTGLLPGCLSGIQGLAVSPDDTLVLASRSENSLLRLVPGR